MYPRCLISPCLALLSAAGLLGQIPTGIISGTVRDPSGASLPGAAITVKSRANNSIREITADPSGSFHLTNLPPGRYEISVTKEGFRPLRERSVEVQVDRTAALALVMEVGPVSETVDVPSKSAPVDEDTGGTAAEVLSFLELDEMIQDTRTVTDLGYLVSGVSRRASGGLGSGFVIGGARADNTNFVVDGFSDYDPRTGGPQTMPNYDAVEEFRVQTTGSTAEYGRLAGGVMDMVLRSGSNVPHGGAFEYFRSDALAARNFFDTQKSRLLSNQFGASLGGPVTMPHVYHGRDRTFFFASWEAVRQYSGGNRLSEVPTALERTGNFSRTLNANGTPLVLRDPMSGNAPFAGNIVPTARIDPIAASLISYFPLPNNSDPANNYHADAVNHTHWDNVLLKLDEHATENDSLSFRYVTRLTANTNPYTGSPLGDFGSYADTRSTLAGFNYTRIFSAALVNEFRAGLVRTSDHESSLSAGSSINPLLGLPQQGFPSFTILNLAALGDSPSIPLDFTVNNYEVADAVSRTHGSHLFKFGVDVLRTQFFQLLNYNARGSFNFLGRWTNAPLADFLLGLADSTSRQTASSPAYLFSTDYGFFAQDQWAITPRLTLSYGLRWEMLHPPDEKYGRISSFVPEVGKLVIADARTIPNLAQSVAAAGLAGLVTTAAQAGLPHSLVYPNNRNLAPRFGFAWRPTKSEHMVVRGGYGIYYADSLLNPIRNDLTNVYPFTVSQTFNRVAGQPSALTLENPFPDKLVTLPGVTNVNGFELHPQPQYLESYTLSVEQQLDKYTTLEVEFAGSRGTHLERQYDLNQEFRVAALRQPGGVYPRPYAGFGSINFYAFGSNSVYNSGQISLRRRYRNGMFFSASYVYGKSIDDASQVSGNSAGDYPGVQNSRDLAAERGRSDWDTGHSFLAFAAYTLPIRGGALARGWQISATARMYTGQPFTPRVGNTNVDLGDPGRPDRVSKGTLPGPSVKEWFNLAAFPVVPLTAFRFGDAGRNILDGPGNITVSTALLKNLRLRDQLNAQFRCEAINVLNRANFGQPVNFVDATNAGQLVSAEGGRTMQLGLRFRF